MLADVGTTSQTLVNAGGCDSVLTTITSYAPNSAIIINETTCSQSEAGTTTDTIFMTGICDSLVTTITTFTPINAYLTINENVLTVFPNGMIYQWVNCESSFSEILGESNQTFTASSNGSYAAVVDDGICIDTTSCENIMGIGIIENNFETEIKLYPNPTNGLLTIEMEGSFETIEITVKNDIGQVIISKTEPITIFNVNLTKYSSGIYFLHISADNKSAVFKVLKE